MRPSSALARLRPLIFLIALAAIATTTLACGDDQAATDDATVTIVSPEADDIFSTAEVEVTGTALGADSVEVNGTTIDVEDGQWAGEVRIDEVGTIELVATAGQATDTVEILVDTIHPEVVIESPQRGLVLDSADADRDVTVSGQMVDAGPSGLAYLEVNGRTADVDEEGYFESSITVDEGFNRFEVKAVDQATNERLVRQGIIYGPLADPSSPIEEAARLDLTNPEGTTALAEVIEAYLTPERVDSFLAEGISEEDVPVELTSITWETLDLDLDTSDGVVEVTVDLTDFRIDGQFQLDEESDVLDGFVEIAAITIEMDVVLSADENNQLTVDIPDSQVTLNEDDVTIDIAGESPQWLQSAITSILLYGFEAFVGQLVEDTLYDPSLLTQEIEFFNRTVEITFRLEDVVTSPTGISGYLGLEFPAEAHPDVPDVAGALHRPLGGALGGSIFRPVTVHSNRTSADRGVHALWQSGLFHQTVGPEDLSETALPFELTADGLGTLLDPRIRDIHDVDTPAEIRLRPQLSPVVEFREEGKENDATIHVADFLVDFILRPDANTSTRFLTVALHLEIDVSLIIEDNQIDLEIDVSATGDVVDEPEFEFDHDDVLKLITNLIELVPSFLADDLTLATEAALEWARLSDPTVEIHGEERDRISAGLTIEAVPEFIEDDELDE